MDIFDISKTFRELSRTSETAETAETAETDQRAENDAQSQNTAPKNAHNTSKDTFEKAPPSGTVRKRYGSPVPFEFGALKGEKVFHNQHKGILSEAEESPRDGFEKAPPKGSPVPPFGSWGTRFNGRPPEGAKYGDTEKSPGGGFMTEILDKNGKRIGFYLGGVPRNSDKLTPVGMPVPEVPKEKPAGSTDNGFKITETRNEDGSTEITITNRQGQVIPVLHAHNHDVGKKDSKDEKPQEKNDSKTNKPIKYDFPPEKLGRYSSGAKVNVRTTPSKAVSLPPPKPIDLDGEPETVFVHPPGSRSDSTTKKE